jgi:hypothetical protein
MPVSYECPNCGGSLPADCSGRVVTCGYCGSSVRIGEDHGEKRNELPDDVRDDISELLRNDRKIEAIKLYRKHVTASLKESKLAVESMAREMGLPVRTGSCSAVILLAVATAAFLLLFIVS